MGLKKIVSVDSGKYATKALIKAGDMSKKFSFRTKMDATNEDKASDAKSCVFEYAGDKVLIGEEAETADYDKSKAKDIHKYSTYAAIAQLVEDGDTIALAIGCPLSIYNNVEERKLYRDFMVDQGKISVIVNGKSKSFTIEKTIVCPEGSGIIYKNPAKYKNSLVGIIDIGGLNSNCCIYDKLTPVKSTCVTTNLGANIMRNELKLRLNSAFPEVNLQDWQMEDIIQKGYIKSHKEESAVIISEFLQKHVNSILQECVKKGWDIKNIDLIFVGGGSKLFEAEIKRMIPDAEISASAEWDNVEGFAELGAVKYGK
jgi:plasmid segregation protein ParM